MPLSPRLPARRATRVLLILVALGTAVAVGGIVYLRYFYGNDAPPPFELSSFAVLLPFRRSTARRPRRRWRRSRQPLWAALAAIALIATAGHTENATAASKAPAAGASCTKVGATATAGATKLRCALSGKKKRWTVVVTQAPTAPTATTKEGSPAPTSASTGETPAATAIEGTYKIGPGSAAGYRVRELFVGGLAKTDAVGRSEAVTGTVILGRTGSALQVLSVNAAVDMTKLVSDESRRDSRMRSTGIETDKFPTATFVSSTAVTLDADSEAAKPVKATVPGKLTLHGVTRDVQIPVDAQLRSGTLEIVGRLAINMKDYAIEPPEIADFVKADDDGSFEFKLVLKKG